MSMSWPLLAYTLLSLVACGTLGVQGICALRGHGTKVQMPAIVAVLVCALASGVFACMRFGHLDRLFNVFGNPASAVARGYYAVVLVLVVAVVFLVMLRRSDEEGRVPAWCAVLAVAAGVLGVYALGANDTATIANVAKTWLTVAYFFAAAAVAGTLVVGGIGSVREGAASQGVSASAIVSALATGVMSIVFAFVSPNLGSRAASITSSTYGIVPGHPSGTSVSDLAQSVGFSSPAFWAGTVVAGIAVPLASALALRKVKGVTGALVAAVGLVCLLVGVACTLNLFLRSASGTQIFA